MTIIKPEKLKKSDKIGIIAISGQIKDQSRLEKIKFFFEQHGYQAEISKSCKKSHRYMAGESDEECINTLHEYFLNPEIKAIVCARGGYGTLRLINQIDWKIIKNNPKIFAGYSDITVLLNLIYKKTGLITFHSAMPYGDFSENIEEYTEKSFFETLKGIKKEYKSENNTVYKSGIAKGYLWGGNLSSLVSLCGIDFIPNKNLILFLEDLNEPAYKIDKMLTQLFNIEKIRKNVKGLALGEFIHCDNEEYINDVIKELTNKLNIPVCKGFKITHEKIKETIPVGVKAALDTQTGIIKINEDYLL